MPNVKGAVLTERDKALLSFVGVARYASAEQVHRLFFEGRSKKQTYRRLAKLCTPGGRPGLGAHLLRPERRRAAHPLAPRPPAASDIGARFLEHIGLLEGKVVQLDVGNTGGKLEGSQQAAQETQ